VDKADNQAVARAMIEVEANQVEANQVEVNQVAEAKRVVAEAKRVVAAVDHGAVAAARVPAAATARFTGDEQGGTRASLEGDSPLLSPAAALVLCTQLSQDDFLVSIKY
jgi:hypothetical protein